MKYIPSRGPTYGGFSRPTHSEGPNKALALYVEDDPLNHEVARARLAAKYDVLIASSDREACELVSRHGSALSVILMDIELKGSLLDGIDLTRLLRGKLEANRRPTYAREVPTLDVPVLFVTAYGQRFQQAELLDAGGDAVIHKPIDFMQLQAAITRTYLSRQKA